MQYYSNDWDEDEELMKAQRAKKKETRQPLPAELEVKWCINLNRP